MTSFQSGSATTAPAADVRLRPIDATDRSAIRRWMSTLDMVRFTVVVPTPDCALALPYDAGAADRYLAALLSDPRRLSFAIELDGVHVGNVGLKDMDPRTRSAECFVELGEAGAKGRGVATWAMADVLDHAFYERELFEVRLGVFEFNDAARRLYDRLGFVPSGHYGWHWADGRYWEILEMRIDVMAWTQRRAHIERRVRPA